MEIGISKKGDLRILSLRGNLRLQHCRVIDKHLDALLANGARWVVLDLSGVTWIGGEGVDSLRRGVARYRSREASLMLLSEAACVREAFRASAGAAGPEDVLHEDWGGLEARLLERGLALPPAAFGNGPFSRS